MRVSDRMPTLPIDDVLDDVVAAAAANRPVVLQAPPGAGKTTKVPLALLDGVWRGDGRILVLEPRRLAARASARRMASLLDEPVGRQVGYVTRDERKVSSATRIEVVTEGVLVRRLQRDMSLTGVAAVIFDEFHERSLDADLGLALTLEVRDALRDDLRVLVMSATLDGERIARLLDDPAVVTSAGRAFPVTTTHRPLPGPPTRRVLVPAVADSVTDALRQTDGDVLVFLPGAGDIRAVQRRLEEVGTPSGVVLAPLFGALAPQEQDRALDPTPAGIRKVVLATDIAETSLTIEGVRVVVDAGLTRVPRFDPRTGMSRLVTVRVSKASADQRRGRAGRTAPGVCYRCWSEREEHALDDFREPAIVQADLAGFALELARWGVTDPATLRLLDPPPVSTFDRAVGLLRELDALDEAGRITDHGRALADLPLHPRLAHMVVRAGELGLAGLACDVAALLADRDPLSSPPESSCADLTVRLRLLADPSAAPPAGTRLRRGALARARREARRLRQATGTSGTPERWSAGTEDVLVAEPVGALLALAYPDRIAQRRPAARGRFLLAAGRGGELPEADLLAGEDLLVVADVDRGQTRARIRLAAPVAPDDLRLVLAGHLADEDVVDWDDEVGDVVAEHRERLGSLVLARAPLPEPAPGATTAALLQGIRARGLDLLPLDRSVQELRERVAFLRRTFGDPWPDWSDEVLLATLEDWLAPFLTGCRRRRDLDRIPLLDALLSRFDHRQRQQLDQLAPTHLRVPSGSRVRIDYGQGETPVLAVKLQELFGARTTPSVAGGRVPVVLHLLSPARRPVQVTQDLAGFWERSYPAVRSEMRGRYPKHPWPEDPLSAVPTARTKRRR